ncbi:MAG: hypothetical protein IIV90_07445, partial [Oscillospiraceae bacterium]|nr:hypothetical protein [Oscillospiraceae bacterium]
MGSILDNIKTAGTEIQNELTEKIKEGTDAASQSEQLGALFKEMPEGHYELVVFGGENHVRGVDCERRHHEARYVALLLRRRLL